MAKDKFTLYSEAEAEAKATIGNTVLLEVEKSAMAAFDSAKNDATDWPYWKQSFDNRRNFYTQLKNPGVLPAVVGRMIGQKLQVPK